MAEFLEKPGGEWVGSALINAGVYVLEHEVLEMVPSGRHATRSSAASSPVSPPLGKLFGFTGTSYWRDIGTPESYLEAHFDLLQNSLVTHVADELGDSLPVRVARGARRGGREDRTARLHRGRAW